MDRRSFIVSSGSLGLVVCTVGGVTVAHAHDQSLGERPWSAAPEAKSADPRIRAMAYAILAPNAFNLQPWLAELPGDDLLVLHCDLALRLPEADADDRMTVITFGNFLELLRMAAAQDGYSLAIERFPKGRPVSQLDSRPIAYVKFVRGGAAPDPLFAQVLERRTCKRPFESRPVSDECVQQLCTVGATKAMIHASNEAGLVRQVRGLAVDGFAIEKHTARINNEQARVSRIGVEQVEASPDGIDLTGSAIEAALQKEEISRSLLRQPNSQATRNQLEGYRALSETAAAYVWICTEGNSREAQLDAGCDWLRVHLKATELGLSFEPQSPPLNSYPEVASLSHAMHDLLQIPVGRRAQMLSRLGYAAQMPPAVRWSVESKILNT